MRFSPPNIKLAYLYRDASNYKNWGEVVFNNPKLRTIEELKQLIEGFLIDGEFFYSEDWGIPDLHFKEYPWDCEIDHDWHQFENFIETDEVAVYDLEEFLSRKHPLREEWIRIMRSTKNQNFENSHEATFS